MPLHWQWPSLDSDFKVKERFTDTILLHSCACEVVALACKNPRRSGWQVHGHAAQTGSSTAKGITKFGAPGVLFRRFAVGLIQGHEDRLRISAPIGVSSLQ